MSIDSGPSDQQSIRRYVEERILPLAPAEEPVPFRGQLDASSEDLPFFEELDASLRRTPALIWNLTGPSGSGKTHLARWAAAQWGKRFLAGSRQSPAPLWIAAQRLQTALADDRSLIGGPFAFALALADEIPGESPESLARLLTREEFIIILDKDEDPSLQDWTLKLPMGMPPCLRILHIAIRDSLGGHCVRLSPWDREMALLAAHRRRGAEGVKLIEALEASPVAALATHPPFVTWLLGQEIRADATTGPSNWLERYLHELYESLSGEIPSVEKWSERLLLRPDESTALRLAARRLQLHGSRGDDRAVGRVHRAYLVWKALESDCRDTFLEAQLLDEDALSLLESVPFSAGTLDRLVWRSTTSPVAKANLVNLHWRLRKTPLPENIDLSGISGLELSGHPFPGGLKKLMLGESNLSGISLGKPSMQKCDFSSCSFRDASLSGVTFHTCKMSECSFELADLSDARIETCALENLQLTEAILSGATFLDCGFSKVAFGQTGEGAPQRFTMCVFEGCDITRMAASGLFLAECKFRETDFAGLSAPQFEAAGSTFEKCDFLGFGAPGAKLTEAKFTRCLLADVCLEGADLRKAIFKDVEFQPGPGSRAGHTDTLMRDDPMHGSKSGFYADDMADGVYLDPELTRTADLRNCDLRGATLNGTDLFRVDLRGARMDPDFLARARRMRAFVS